MSDETITSTQPNWEEIAVNLNENLKEYKFFSDQVRFNATLYQGFQILLDKVTKIEEKLNEQKETK